MLGRGRMSSQGHARAGLSSIPSLFHVPSQRQGSEQQTSGRPGGSQTSWPEVNDLGRGLLQHHSSKASILQHSASFMDQLSHPYMTTAKTIALTLQTFVGKVMSLLFNMLSRLVIAFLPRSKHLLISWLQSRMICSDFGAQENKV